MPSCSGAKVETGISKTGRPAQLGVLLFAALAVGCKEEEVDVVSGGTLSCQEADTRIWQQLSRPEHLPSWQSCSIDGDCTAEFAPTFECAERNARVTNCVVPMARAKLDAGVAFFLALERELCPSVQRGCRGGPSCPPTQVRCVSNTCRAVPPDAGTT